MIYSLHSLLLLLLVLSLFSFSSPRLLSVILISRHGTRAPNPNLDQLCPADQGNLVKYTDMEISLAGLTGKGMVELYELGTYTKQKYLLNKPEPFLHHYFDNQEMYIRAVAEDRTLQSAVAWGQALYGPGQAPKGYYADLPSPVPVYTLPDEMDNLLEIRKAACKRRLKRDVRKYDASVLVELYANNAALIEQIGKMCGVDLNSAIVGSGDNLGDAVKDITDAFTFDIIEGFQPIAGLTLDSLLAFRTVAVQQLIGRILGTDEQVTYLNGALPSTMRDDFLKSIQGAPDALKFYAYHGHREMLYAVGKYFEIDFDIDFPGLPKGAIPPATSLFFEVHENEPAEGAVGNAVSHSVKVFLWIPCNGNAARAHPHYANSPAGAEPHVNTHWEKTSGLDCPAQQVKLKSCKELDCTWEEYLAIEETRVKRTGPWETLCDYEPETSKLAMLGPAAEGAQRAVDATLKDGMNMTLITGLSVVFVFLVGVAYVSRKQAAHDYHQLP